MLAGSISTYETQTHNYWQQNGQLQQGTEGNVPVFDYRPGYSSYYHNSETTKRRIVLHFTTGYLGGDVSTLTTPNLHVSVSFVVARNGRIYRLFPTGKWSYHTGPGTIGGNETISKSSIGIEISNIGYLDRANDWLWNYYGDRYCRISETQYFTQLAQPYREKQYYASYTNAQYVAVSALLDALTVKHGIARSFLPTSTRYQPFQNSAAGQAYSGICSHVNYRSSGKWDIGPAFDWAAIGA